MRRSVGLLALLPALTLLAACGGSPNVIGTYNYSIDVPSTRSSPGISFLDASVRIEAQSGGSFSGTFLTDGRSFPLSGAISGTIWRPTISFVFVATDMTVANNAFWSNGNVSGTYSALIPAKRTRSRGLSRWPGPPRLCLCLNCALRGARWRSSRRVRRAPYWRGDAGRQLVRLRNRLHSTHVDSDASRARVSCTESLDACTPHPWGSSDGL